MNLKPFDLEKALAGESVVTRDGQPIKIISANSDHPTHKVIGERIGDYRHYALRWTHDGTYNIGKDKISLDLFMAPVKRQEWGNIYSIEDSTEYAIGTSFSSEELAIKAGIASSKYIKTVLIREWEE